MMSALYNITGQTANQYYLLFCSVSLFDPLTITFVIEGSEILHDVHIFSMTKKQKIMNNISLYSNNLNI